MFNLEFITFINKKLFKNGKIIYDYQLLLCSRSNLSNAINKNYNRTFLEAVDHFCVSPSPTEVINKNYNRTFLEAVDHFCVSHSPTINKNYRQFDK